MASTWGKDLASLFPMVFGSTKNLNKIVGLPGYPWRNEKICTRNHLDSHIFPCLVVCFSLRNETLYHLKQNNAAIGILRFIIILSNRWSSPTTETWVDSYSYSCTPSDIGCKLSRSGGDDVRFQLGGLYICITFPVTMSDITVTSSPLQRPWSIQLHQLHSSHGQCCP